MNHVHNTFFHLYEKEKRATVQNTADKEMGTYKHEER